MIERVCYHLLKHNSKKLISFAWRKQTGIGKEPDINLAQCQVHDLCGVFKLFFRELPEPLFPFSTYEPVVKLATKFTVDNNLDNFFGELNRILSTLPKENLSLLLFLFKYLAALEAHVQQNKMTRANLSIVFAPNLLRPVTETIDYHLQLGSYSTPTYT